MLQSRNIFDSINNGIGLRHDIIFTMLQQKIIGL